MRAFALCQLTGEDDLFELEPGDIIGRMELAALSIEDARISEAHAMISLREGELRLLALRGRFRVKQEVCSQIALTDGLEIELAQDIYLKVLEVYLPDHILGLEIPGFTQMALPQTMTLFAQNPPVIRSGYDNSGDAIFWSLDGSHRVTLLHEQRTMQLKAQDHIKIKDLEVEIISIPVNSASRPKTVPFHAAPQQLEILETGVRIVQDDTNSALITGLPGKILATLLLYGPTMTWEQIVEHVWPGDRSLELALRRRFDCSLSRLRSRLQRLGLPAQMVRMSGTGLVTLELTEQLKLVTSQPQSA